MKQPFIGYVTTASSLNTPIALRGRILATAVALAVSCRLQVPATELDNAATYFTDHIEPTVLRVVCQFNEQTILDLKYAAQIAKQFWLQRYDVLHKCPRLGSSQSFFHSTFSVDTYFSESEVEFFNQYQSDIAKIYDVVCPLVQEILAPGNLS